MVGVSLRQKPAYATDQNASASLRPASIRPVSGTPAWARNDHAPGAPGAPRPASPWDTWTIPPKPAALNRTRKPSPRPIESANPADLAESTGTGTITAVTDPATEPSPPFRPWRIDFARPEVVEYPATEHPVVEPPITEPSDSATVARRLLLLLGLAYLFLAALASGLAYTGYFTTSGDSSRGSGTSSIRSGTRMNTANDGEESSESFEPSEPSEGTLPPQPPSPRPPTRDPDAPGLHTRPDGSRYLVMPLPADLADRFRGRANAVHAVQATHAVPAMSGGAL